MLFVSAKRDDVECMNICGAFCCTFSGYFGGSRSGFMIGGSNFTSQRKLRMMRGGQMFLIRF